MKCFEIYVSACIIYKSENQHREMLRGKEES